MEKVDKVHKTMYYSGYHSLLLLLGSLVSVELPLVEVEQFVLSELLYSVFVFVNLCCEGGTQVSA